MTICAQIALCRQKITLINARRPVIQRHNNRASLSEWFMILAGALNIHDDNNLIYNIYIYLAFPDLQCILKVKTLIN